MLMELGQIYINNMLSHSRLKYTSFFLFLISLPYISMGPLKDSVWPIVKRACCSPHHVRPYIHLCKKRKCMYSRGCIICIFFFFFFLFFCTFKHLCIMYCVNIHQAIEGSTSLTIIGKQVKTLWKISVRKFTLSNRGKHKLDQTIIEKKKWLNRCGKYLQISYLGG